MDTTEIRTIEALLGSLFDDGSLRRFIAELPQGKELLAEIPAHSFAETAFVAGKLLDRYGLLDADLFERLLHKRPQRWIDIGRVRDEVLAARGSTDKSLAFRRQGDNPVLVTVSDDSETSRISRRRRRRRRRRSRATHAAAIRAFVPAVRAPIAKLVGKLAVIMAACWGLALLLLTALVALITVAPVLGAADHRARLLLIGVPEKIITDLDYPAEAYSQTGLDMLARLGIYAGSGLLTGTGWERDAMFLSAAVGGAVLILARRRRWRLCVAVAALVWPACAAGLLCYAHAVGVDHVVLDMAEKGRCRMGPSLSETIRFEVCSWLANATELNTGRRQALGGLWTWSVFALGILLWTSVRAAWRLRSARTWIEAMWRTGASAAAVLYTLLFVTMILQAPMAHAVAYWGLSYPRVTAIESTCAPELAVAVQHNPRCRIFDISETAREEIILFNAACVSTDAEGSQATSNQPWQTKIWPPQSRAVDHCIQRSESKQPLLNRD